MYFASMKNILSFLAVCAALTIAEPTSMLVFSPDPFPLGLVEQGTTKHIVLHGKNTGKQTIELETVMSQNVGSSGFKFPTKITPASDFKIEFDLNTANLEGPFTHRIILVEKGGTPHVTLVEGKVDSPILFSQQILDAGYLVPGSKPSWTIYAYNVNGAKFNLELDAEAAKHFQLTTTPVLLNTEKFDEIKEGGKVPGLKLNLTFHNPGNGPVNPKIRSVRQIVNLKTNAWPKATPSLFIVGYWKDK